ncbi:PA2817 family protein [Litoribrevibacter euphylliae]|uniref:PA2817 family protein n=1 Tax=Litoribrevibacter euphylliae TaxID=1834034 RepID=A0ABV7H8A0_9GAMM
MSESRFAQLPEAEQENILFHLRLLKQSYEAFREKEPFLGQDLDQDAIAFLAAYEQLIKDMVHLDPNHVFSGQQLVTQQISKYPDLTECWARDLLWYFGGDCLHYMPDDEIEKFQQLDDARFEAIDEGKAFQREKVRNRIFGLH